MKDLNIKTKQIWSNSASRNKVKPDPSAMGNAPGGRISCIASGSNSASRNLKIVEQAPAKVNIYLKVLGKRKDGYHNIQTLFERINIRDTIVVSTAAKGIQIQAKGISIPCGQTNICFKAASIVKKAFKIRSGVKIMIAKNIPVAAGLGGGSSDAASVLKALNRLWNLGLTKEDMMGFGNSIGSDVAFFLKGSRFAFGTGRGEILHPVKSRVKAWHVLIYPAIKLLSGYIYKRYAKKRYFTLTEAGGADKIPSPETSIGTVGQLNALLYNDLESIVLASKPLINKIKCTLVECGAEKAIVSGSGPSVFSIFNSRYEAMMVKRRCLKRLPVTQAWRVFVIEAY